MNKRENQNLNKNRERTKQYKKTTDKYKPIQYGRATENNRKIKSANRKNPNDHYSNLKKSNLKQEKQEKRTHLPIVPTLVLILGFAIGAFLYTNKSDGANVVKKYYSLLGEKNYDQMYELVDTDLSKEDFVNRVKNIYEGIEFSNAKVSIMGNSHLEQENTTQENSTKTIKIFGSKNSNNGSGVTEESQDNNNSINSENTQENLDSSKEQNDNESANNTKDQNNNGGLNSSNQSVTYSVSAKSVAGEIKFTRTSEIVNVDGKAKIKWSSSDIFPDLEDDEKVRVRKISAKRGTIFDRNGYTLAKDSDAYIAKLVPSKVTENTDFSKLSELSEIDKETLKKQVNEEKKRLETSNQSENYIRLKKFSKDDQDLKNKFLQIKGVLITDEKSREYPRGEAFSLLLGYVQDAEGKDGIEKEFNNTLKEKEGSEIYIEDKNGNIKKSIAKIDAKDGEDVKLTIDAKVQEKIYNEFKDEKSAVVNINYKTGEILALVSTPSYDNNLFSLGMSESEWDKLKNDVSTPLYSRFLGTYVPGSSIKPVVAAIGLEENSISPDEDFGKYGLKWQKDESWGDFYITTLNEDRGENTENNLKNAIAFSDNIYFAKVALKIGKESLCAGFNKFGFNENLNFVSNMQKSTYGEISTEKDLASTGFGQGNLLVNPIMMASIYSSFANEGSMIKPYIEYEKEEKNRVKYYKENVISKENANIIKEDLKQVVQIGTAKVAKDIGKNLYGKTGTAEIKASKKDKDGSEIGWFDMFDEDGNLIVTMCENVEKKGGSNYVVKKVCNILKS